MPARRPALRHRHDADARDAARDGRRRGRRRRVRRGPDGQPARSRSRPALLGKEAALYVPSGTMANQLAIRVLARPRHRGAVPRPRRTCTATRPRPRRVNAACSCARCADAARRRRAPTRRGAAPTSPPPAADLAGRDREHPHAGERARRSAPPRCGRVASAARGDGLRVHCRRRAHLERGGRARRDAARRSPRRADTVMFCLSKGLGAPVGSLLCGPRRRDRRGARATAAGSAAGCARPGVHRGGGRSSRSRRWSSGWPTTTHARGGSPTRSPTASPGCVDPDDGAHEHRVRRARPRCPTSSSSGSTSAGSRAGTIDPRTVRFVTHKDVDDDGLRHAIDAIDEIAKQER